MANTVKKILIVGESQTGKTSLIQSFLDQDGGNPGAASMIKNSNSDFSLKIVMIDGQKVRMQLWDNGHSKDPISTFQPLYTRHASGCIIVANVTNNQSIKKANNWRDTFDQKTKVSDEASYPTALFINHVGQLPEDDTKKEEVQKQFGNLDKFTSLYHVSVSEPQQIYDAFCDFTAMILLHQSQEQRTSTDAYLEQDKTIKPVKKGGQGPSASGQSNGNADDINKKMKQQDLDEDKSFKITREKTATLTQNKKKKSCKC